MNEIVIRQAIPQDFTGIKNIHRNCDDPWHNIDECIAWISKRLERGFYIQVAEIDKKIVGHGEWILNHDFNDKFLYLGMLQIDEDFQKRGIGSKMIEDGIRVAKEQGCSKIVTIPESDNTSKEFYMKCGFVSGRYIKNVTLPTYDYGYSQNYEKSENVPLSVVKEHLFVFGAAQASSRHMWEIYNQKPNTDDRIVATMLSDDGNYMQLGWFDDNDTAFALYWNNFPHPICVKDFLTFAYNLGLKKVSFYFFEEYEGLFNEFDFEIEKDNIEIYKSIN